jgi:Fe-S cluster assembly protein SufB
MSAGKVIHAAPDTTSTITSKSISKDGGRAVYRGLLKVAKGATNAKAFVRRHALLLDQQSRSDTYPSIEIDEERVDIGHEATVSTVSDEQLFDLQSRGIDRDRGEDTDRERLLRHVRQGAADGVRGRAESTARASDGGSIG